MEHTSPLSLSANPNPVLIEHIEKYGGKLGALQMVSDEYIKDPESFHEIGIKVGPKFMPTIIGPNEMVSDFVWKDLLAKYGFEDDTNSQFLLRASVPGDYRSLIDIIETKKDTLYRYDDSDTAQNRTNRAIHEIRLRMQDAVLIPRYAKLAGVPFDKNAISFGIVPKLASSHIIVTEHPNHEDVLIQEGPFKTNYRNSTFFLSSVDYDSDVTLKVKKFLNFLRDRGVLQVDIAYNLELGLDSEGNIVLFQIRELCKKMIIGSQALHLAKNHTQYIHTILTTIPDGSTKKFRYDTFSISETNIENEISNELPPYFARLYGATGSQFTSRNLEPSMHGIMFENLNAPGIGEHSNMRFIQYALQQPTGGIVIAGVDSGGYGSFGSDIERDLKDTYGKYDNDGKPIMPIVTLKRNGSEIELK